MSSLLAISLRVQMPTILPSPLLCFYVSANDNLLWLKSNVPGARCFLWRRQTGGTEEEGKSHMMLSKCSTTKLQPPALTSNLILLSLYSTSYLPTVLTLIS